MSVTRSRADAPREYETIYILRPNVGQDEATKVATRVSEVVDKAGAKLTQVDTWGRRQLAYPVRKHKRGVYVYVKYVGGGEAVKELERNFRMLDEVLKYQTVMVNPEVLEMPTADPDAVKFETIEPAGDDEEDLSWEQELGLAEAEHQAPADSGDDSDDAGDDKSSDADTQDESEEEGEE